MRKLNIDWLPTFPISIIQKWDNINQFLYQLGNLSDKKCVNMKATLQKTQSLAGVVLKVKYIWKLNLEVNWLIIVENVGFAKEKIKIEI